MKFAEVRLHASRVDILAEFYATHLGLRLIEHAPRHVRLGAGRSVLTFVQDIADAQHHFVFNIAPGQFAEAKAWLSARCPLVRGETGADQFHFANWNADAIYFYDPAGNLVELIARHTLPTSRGSPGTPGSPGSPGSPSEATFDAQALLGISEIGIVTDDVRATAVRACAALGAPVYRSELNGAFAPVGDEEGLLIIVANGRPWFPDRALAAQPSPVEIMLGGAAFAEPIRLTPDVTITPSPP